MTALDALVARAAEPGGALPELEGALRPGADRPAVARGFVEAARRRVLAQHRGGGSGVAVVFGWTHLVDQLTVGLHRALAAELGVSPGAGALVALGGFGRAELSPHSDLDLLILGDAPELELLARAVPEPLRAAGLEVQCAARTLAGSAEVARADHRLRTSLLDARFLSGGAAWAQPYEREVLAAELFGPGAPAFAQAMLGELEVRHRRYGDTVYLLEPNVVEGEGGLRDIRTALWIAQVRFRARTARELVAAGAVPAEEIEALDAAKDFLLRLRNHLHLGAGRKEDRLTYEAQDEAAPALGFADAEELLRAYYASANRVGHFARAVIRRAAAGFLPGAPAPGGPPRAVLPGVRLQGGEVHLDPRTVRRKPLTLLAAFEVAQARGAELSPQALAVIRDNLDLVDDRFRRDPAAVELFLRLLRHPRRVGTTLVRMHDVRFLDRFIPEFGRIFCRVQRELNHAYPVDVHSLFTVQELRRLARGEYAQEFPLLTRLVGEVLRPDILYLAALLHDVGKGLGGDHARRGAQVALAVGDRMNLEPRDREYLVFLVENHLLLAHTALGRDLHDEDLIAGFARAVGDAEALKMLYLLTVADLRAVGPGAWTSWKNLLFRELYEKTRAALEGGAVDRGAGDDRAAAVAAELRSAADALGLQASVGAFLDAVDHPRYLLANPVEALTRHLAAFARRGDAPVVERRPVPEEGYTELLLVTRDRPGLFAEVAGLMAAHRLNILSAVLNTRRDGWVLDVFHVSDPQGGQAVEPERWARWHDALAAVLGGRLGFEEAAGERLARRPGGHSPGPRARTRVRVDNGASRRFTVVDVEAADRLGLLYDIARTLTAQGLTIRLAKIATNLDRVADGFYVELVGGGKVDDPAEVSGLVAALEAAVADPPEGGR
ncbi:MAG: [protein-PII] uridylyltransferase [Deferrisomatales bacterium]